MNLGQFENMKVIGQKKGFPLLENDKGERVLLDEKKNLEKGEELRVFLYDDGDIKGTLDHPKLKRGEVGPLNCVSVTNIGAFLDWGLKKDLFLPFSEQQGHVVQGKNYFVAVYIDKSNRLCGSMQIQKHLQGTDQFEENDEVNGMVYNIVPEIGAFVVVDKKYQGLIRRENYQGILEPGDEIKARVMHVKEDGRLDLSCRERAHLQMDRDAQLIYDTLVEEHGFLPCNDKSDPRVIRDLFGISKSAYKRAVGRLLKTKQIEFYKHGIRIKR
ncbi:MAG: S1-like domain-containing RNA-binding protein [Tissierellia bacterium]|nr:S1-like domain-containing RNA-binding protein [Tissierellia bacterium]